MTIALGVADIVLWGIVTFSLLVVFHEMGHFLAARAFGVKVHEFMIGLPGPALRLRTKNMTWGVTAIPLGGYVRIAGMEPGPEDPLLADALVAVRDRSAADPHLLAAHLTVPVDRAEALLATLADWKAVEQTDGETYRFSLEGDTGQRGGSSLLDLARRSTYRGQSTSRRITILAMGVVTNLVVAILTFTVVLSVWGYYTYTTRLDSVEPGTPAAEAGLRRGDVLLAVDGTTVTAWDDFQRLMMNTEPGQSVALDIERGSERLAIDVTLAERAGHGFLGVGPTEVPVRPGVIESLGESLRLTGLVFRSILDLFNPSTFSTTVQSARGVVGVSVMAAEAAHAGALSYAALVAMLSLSLGVMNVIPLPPLDGGKIVLEIIERIMGRPLARNAVLALSSVGAVLLFSLIGYIMYADIVRIAQ